jgi:hypothetical protein
MKKLSFFLLAALLTMAAPAQTIFPTQFKAPAEFNTGTPITYYCCPLKVEKP